MSVAMRIVLDEQRSFFPGETICGKVILSCQKSFTPHGLRLIWAGGVTIRPTPQDQESFIYFKRNYATCNDKLKGKKSGKAWTYKSSAFVENYDTSIPLRLELKQAYSYSFAFNIQIPIDIPLPSSTATENSMLGGSILYTLESCLDLTMNDPTPAQTHIVVTVLERMDVRLPELNIPRNVESAYSLWLTDTPKTNPCDYRTALCVTLPCQAVTRGGKIPIDIHVWHSVEYQRPKGVTVRLIRVRQLRYQGCIYAFPDENVLSMRADIDLIEENNFMQTFQCALPIREDLTPSISDVAKLLEISYKVHIKVQLQEGTYKTLNGESHAFMLVEAPILIGTLPIIIDNKTVPPRNGLVLAAIDSKQSVGSKDNESESVNSAELYKKYSSSDDGSKGRNSSKQESPTEQKPRTFWGTIRLPGIKRNQSKGDPTTSDYYKPPTNDTIDDNPIQNHNATPSTKNTDQVYPTDSSHYDSSQSASSPRTEVDIISTQLQKLHEPSYATTMSAVELKPDAKDDDTTNIKTDASIRINTTRPTNPIEKGIPPVKEKNRTRSLSSKDAKTIPKGGRAAHVRIVNIFVSSDEEDGDDEIQPSSPGADNRKSYQWITGPTPSEGVSQRKPPSTHVPQHYTEYSADAYSDSDSDGSDNSPLSLVSRQTRNKYPLQ